MADESEADQPSAVKMEEVGKGVGVGERERGLEVDSEVQGTEPGQPSSHLAHVHTLPTAGAGGTTVPESIITATASGSGSGSRSSRRKKMACLTCNRDRRFCDTALPACSRCVQKGVSCLYPAGAAAAAVIKRDPVPRPEKRKIACVNCRASKRFCQGIEEGKDACEMCRTRGLVCVFIDSNQSQAPASGSLTGLRRSSGSASSLATSSGGAMGGGGGGPTRRGRSASNKPAKGTRGATGATSSTARRRHRKKRVSSSEDETSDPTTSEEDEDEDLYLDEDSEFVVKESAVAAAAAAGKAVKVEPSMTDHHLVDVGLAAASVTAAAVNAAATAFSSSPDDFHFTHTDDGLSLSASPGFPNLPPGHPAAPLQQHFTSSSSSSSSSSQQKRPSQGTVYSHSRSGSSSGGGATLFTFTFPTATTSMPASLNHAAYSPTIDPSYGAATSLPPYLQQTTSGGGPMGLGSFPLAMTSGLLVRSSDHDSSAVGALASLSSGSGGPTPSPAIRRWAVSRGDEDVEMDFAEFLEMPAPPGELELSSNVNMEFRYSFTDDSDKPRRPSASSSGGSGQTSVQVGFASAGSPLEGIGSPGSDAWSCLGGRFKGVGWIDDATFFELLRLYFDRYHPMLPIIHPATFLANHRSSHPLLLASVLLNATIFATSDKIRAVKDRLERELFTLSRPYVASLSAMSFSHRPASDPYDGHLPQTYVDSLAGLILLATWCFQAGLGKLGRGMYDVAFALLRKWGMDWEVPWFGMRDASPGREERVRKWIEGEQRRRITFQLLMLGSFARSVSHEKPTMSYQDCHNVRMQCPFNVWDVLSARADFEPEQHPPSDLMITDYTAWIKLEPEDPERKRGLAKLMPVRGLVTTTVVFWALREEVDAFLETLKGMGLSPTTLPAPTTAEFAQLHRTLAKLRRTIVDCLTILPENYRTAEERGQASEIAEQFFVESGHPGYCYLSVLNIIQLRVLRLDLDTSFGVLPVAEMRKIADEWWLGERFSASLTDAILYTRNLEDIIAKNPMLDHCGIGYVQTPFRVGCVHLAILNRYRELASEAAQTDPSGAEAAYRTLIEDSAHDVSTCLTWLGIMADRWGAWIRELHRVFRRMVSESEGIELARRKSVDGTMAMTRLSISLREIEGLEAQENLVPIPLSTEEEPSAGS